MTATAFPSEHHPHVIAFECGECGKFFHPVSGEAIFVRMFGICTPCYDREDPPAKTILDTLKP